MSDGFETLSETDGVHEWFMYTNSLLSSKCEVGECWTEVYRFSAPNLQLERVTMREFMGNERLELKDERKEPSWMLILTSSGNDGLVTRGAMLEIKWSGSLERD